MTPTIPTEDDLRVIADQVWVSYLDPEGVNPLLLDIGPTVDLHNQSRSHMNEDDGGVSASVSVTGAWRGHVVIRCSATASRHAAAALLGVELADVTVEDVTDALGELANIIGGNIKSLLPEPSALSLPHVQVSGVQGWPLVSEVCRLTGTWLQEHVTMRVLASTTDFAGATS